MGEVSVAQRLEKAGALILAGWLKMGRYRY